jgi:ribosomal-protein-alanine N-acetyltransferase
MAYWFPVRLEMNRNVIFKPATESDFAEILRLEEESFNLYDRLDDETLIELYSEFSEGFHIIIVDGVMAGYSVFLLEDDIGYIESIAINNNYKRRGLGLLALQHMIKCLGDMGIKDINLHVRIDNNAAMSLYEKEGFEKKLIVENFYKDGEPAYLYSRNESDLHEIIRRVN